MSLGDGAFFVRNKNLCPQGLIDGGVTHMILSVIQDTLLDAVKLLPFLFITYLIMEYIEHRTSEKSRILMKKSGKLGPAFGGILGLLPQCGFSTAASNLYAGRVITLGTLLAVFLSTSDEMLPVLISEQAPVNTILKILAIKGAIGIFAGFLIDLLNQKRKDYSHEEMRIKQMCDHQHCHCGKENIFSSALHHTLQVFLFIVVISFLLNLLIEFVGKDTLESLLTGKAILGPLLAGLIGLIPNCASSVLLTRLYLSGMLGAGSLLAGLLAGSGVGLLVLYKVNDNLRENIRITLLLYGLGVLCGIAVEVVGGARFIGYNLG